MTRGYGDSRMGARYRRTFDTRGALGKRKASMRWIVYGLAFVLPALGAAAQEMMVYPAKGQSNAQQDRDRYECHTWAVRQTGIDPTRGTPAPAQAAVPPPPAPEAQQGGLFRGAARGAAVGAVGGAIGGDAGKGAAIGAGTGALIGGMRRQDQRRREQAQQDAYRQQVAQAQADQSAASAASRGTYDRAVATCLTGRGYTVG
jgi:hypothetical protein